MSEAKRFTLSTVLIVAAVSSAAAFAAGRSMHEGGATGGNAVIASEPPITTTTSTSMATAALPPGHPVVDPNAIPTTPTPVAAESPLTWKVPAKWQALPNPSTMRLATYRVGPEAEMAVSQAGGAVDANVQRWIDQFGPDAKKSAKVTKKKIAGLDVTIVDVEGTFGGMGSAPGQGGKDGWALLGAIVATPDMPHFFKLTGPAKTVKAARPELDELLASMALK